MASAKTNSRDLTNAVIYARYSSHSQTEQSIEGQLHDAYEYAKREGYAVVGEYIDRAQSGTRDARLDFQRMIEDAAKKQFAVILVWKLDRFARNRYDSAIYKARLKKYGVRVVSVMERIQDNPEGIILEGMLESMAEYYSANLSVNIRRGQRENIAKGKFCGGAVPFGYKVENGRLVADEKRAPIIQEVFRRYADGRPMRVILDDLRARGIRGAGGGELHYNSFSRALINRTYLGEYQYKGETVAGLADPLIDQATFDRVQVHVAAMRRAPQANRAKVTYQLQGKCFCGHCGEHMVGESGKGRHGVVYNYYSCRNKKLRHTCPKKSEKKNFLEWYVVEQTIEYVLAKDRASLIAKAVVNEYNKEFSDDAVKEKENRIRRVEQELEKLVDALTSAPKAAQPRIFARMESLEAEKADLGIDIAKLRIAMKNRITEDTVLSWLKTFCKGDPTDEAFRENIINVFINSVYVYDNRVIVFYNITGGKQVSYIDLEQELDENDPDASDDLGEQNSLSFSHGPEQTPNDSAVPVRIQSQKLHHLRSYTNPKIIFVNGILGLVFDR